MLKKKFLLISLLFLFSCQVFIEPMPKSWDWTFKPRPLSGVRNFPSTDTEYGKGFKDGCEAAWDGVSKGLLREVTKKKYDVKRMSKSPDYGTGWWDGFEQCTYILDWDVT
jgi:hypothetical protein